MLNEWGLWLTWLAVVFEGPLVVAAGLVVLALGVKWIRRLGHV